MKLTILLVALVTISILSLGCRRVINAFIPMVHGSGNVTSESRSVPSFKGVRIETAANLQVSQVDSQGVQLTGDDNILKLLKTEVKDGILVISSDKDFETERPINVSVSSPNMESLELDGSGDIKGLTPLHADKFSADIAGSGSMYFAVTASRLSCDLEGSGNYTVQGKADEFETEIEGSGTIHAFDLQTASAKVKLDGSGDAEVNCKESLSAEVNGSGDIAYKGSPAKVHTETNGSGRISKND